MDPEQLVAQLAELRTQNQQLHQVLQQVQQQQNQHQLSQNQCQSLIQALSELPQSLAQTDTKGLGKPPPLKNTESEFVSWARLTENFVVSTEVTMPLGTLRMLTDQLYTLLISLVEAWRRLHKPWDPFTTGRARGVHGEILSPGRAKLVELQGAVERLEDLMIRYTQRRDARDGQRHTLAEDIRMAALEALLPEELERHVSKIERRSCSLC